MRLKYQNEDWPSIVDELKPLLRLQWEDIALDKEIIEYDPDFDRYDALFKLGILKITTVRADGLLAGWYINFVTPHLHYRTSLFAMLDIYYVAPEFRLGVVGIRLFQEMEKQMRALGVVEIVSITKCHLDISSVFEYLKWRKTGVTYTKILKET